jgi:hypothetical protein
VTFTEFLFHVTFIYLVPASKVVIFDGAGNRINDIAGPFNEDSSVNLTCDSEGGKIESKQIIYLFIHKQYQSVVRFNYLYCRGSSRK